MGESWEFGVLGPLRVVHDGKPVPVGAPQARSVLAVLLLDVGRVVPRDRIIDELWGARPPASAKAQVQGLVSGLRRVLPGLIATRGAGYALDVPAAAVDLERFTREADAARRSVAEGRLAEGADGLRAALALWWGSAFADAATPATVAAAARWDEARVAAVEDLAAVEVDLGRFAVVVSDLTEVVARHPLRERPRGLLMTALARSGRVPEALEAYQDWRRTLDAELGVEPSRDVRALHVRILRGDPELRPAVPVSRKVNRLRQLPAELPDFTGRDELLAELAEPPSDSTVLVVSGVGGLGKTAFAVRLAHRWRAAYPDGQLFATMGGAGAMAVLPRFLRALGVPVDLVPSEQEECAALFRDLLVGQRILLVLDNADDEAAVRPLLPAEPGCAVLATSRSRLSGLEGARRVGLDLFDDDEAARLLTRIAGTADVGPLLAHCGGLPLALRIAGALLVDHPEWTVADLAERLAVERTRLDWLEVGDLAVRASFATSYHQLPEAHRTLFRRLGLLRAPTFDAWVAGVVLDVDHRVAERALEDLVGCGLVEVAGRAAGRLRYRLHDLLRLFAAEMAGQDPPAERRDAVERILGGYLFLAERVAELLPVCVLQPAPGTARRVLVDHVRVGDPTTWFDTEIPSLRAAVDLAAESGMGEHAWELAVVCQRYYDHGGLNDAWLRTTSSALTAEMDPRGRAALLRGLGQLHIYWDRYPEALAVLGESLALSERIDDRHGVARALTGMATVRRVTGRPEASLALCVRAQDLLDEVGDRHGAIQVRAGAATVEAELGRIDRARRLLAEASRLCAELGDDHRTAAVLTRQGEFHLTQREPVLALGCLERSMRIVEALGDRRCTAHVRLKVGLAHLMLGEQDGATVFLVSASALFVDLGDGRGEADAALALGAVAAARCAP